jgi:hypothetical protein
MIRAIVLFTQKPKTKNQAKRCSHSYVLKVAHVAKTCTTSSVMVYKSSVTSLFFNLSASIKSRKWPVMYTSVIHLTNVTKDLFLLSLPL